MALGATAETDWSGSNPEVLRAWTVGDVMVSRVYTVTPEWDLFSTIRLLRRHHISGLPVVDARSNVVGVVSELDIVGGLHRAVGIGRARGLLDLLLAAAKVGRPELLDQTVQYLRRTKVGAVMARKTVSVEPEDSLGEAARMLRQYRISRLPVIRNGRLVGIMTREDVVEALARPDRGRDPRPPMRRYARRPARP
jgi:CBS domain-containing protein